MRMEMDEHATSFLIFVCASRVGDGKPVSTDS